MELTRFQKLLLAVLAGMLAFFGVLMAAFRAHPGVLFEESLLKITEEEGRTVYSGRAYGTPVTITAEWPTNFKAVVDFTIEDRFHDVCEVEYPLEPIETNRGPVNGLRVTKNGALLFQGAYAPDMEAGWFDENGDWDPQIAIRAYGSDPWWGYETTAADAVRFALGPGTSAHGDPAFFGLAVFLSLLLAVQIVFHKQLFRFDHRWARDPEPTEGYLMLERAVWLVVAAVIAVLYIAALVKMY